MVWGCFSASVVEELDFIDTTINAQCYVNLLEQNLAPSVSKFNLPGHCICQHDNDPKLTFFVIIWTARSEKEILQAKNTKSSIIKRMG